MGYLVRRFNDIDNKNLINDSQNVDSIAGDVISEFNICNNGDLSAWRIESLSEIEKVVVPLAITRTSIKELNLISIDEGLLKKYGLQTKQESSQEDVLTNMPIDKLHYNIKNITVGKLKDCVALYWETMDKENHQFTTYSKKYLAYEVATIILKAYKNNEISKDQIKCIKSLKRDFQKEITGMEINL